MKKSIGLAVFCALAASLSWAQGTAQMGGTVKDASGAVIPGAEIKATQTATGAVRTVTDLQQTESLIRKVFGEYNLREVTDEDIRRLSERIASTPPDERFDFGNLLICGIHPDVLRRSSDTGRLKEVASRAGRTALRCGFLSLR